MNKVFLPYSTASREWTFAQVDLESSQNPDRRPGTHDIPAPCGDTGVLPAEHRQSVGCDWPCSPTPPSRRTLARTTPTARIGRLLRGRHLFAAMWKRSSPSRPPLGRSFRVSAWSQPTPRSSATPPARSAARRKSASAPIAFNYDSEALADVLYHPLFGTAGHCPATRRRRPAARGTHSCLSFDPTVDHEEHGVARGLVDLDAVVSISWAA